MLDGEGYVRLTDFNVAKVLEERRTFSMKGTLFCMAPEVILKKGHDAAADFWSLGVLIFEMVTGGPPFFSADKAELKRQVTGLRPRTTAGSPRHHSLLVHDHLRLTSTSSLPRQILGLDAHHANLYFPADVPTACRMLLSQLFVRDPKHRLGARRADLPLLKAHSFFGRLNWERLYAKQLPSPLKHSVEMLVQARAAAGARGRHGLHTADHQDMAPSYMSAQHSALVQGWDYVAP